MKSIREGERPDEGNRSAAGISRFGTFIHSSPLDAPKLSQHGRKHTPSRTSVGGRARGALVFRRVNTLFVVHDETRWFADYQMIPWLPCQQLCGADLPSASDYMLFLLVLLAQERCGR